MDWVDWVVLAVIGVSGLIGFMRGFVREVLGLAAWVLAVVAAIRFASLLQPFARHYIENPDIADPVAFGVVFLVVLVVLGVVAGLIGRAIRGSSLGSIDRSLGLLYGLARGVALAIFAYIAGGMLVPVDRWPPPVQQARLVPYIYGGALRVAAYVPAQYRPRIDPPPGSAASAADLMHSTPSGSALGAKSGTEPKPGTEP